MGGNALKHAKTERKNVVDYTRIKSYIIDKLSEYLKCASLIEAPEKESFGDLDVLYMYDASIGVNELITRLFNPVEIVRNGNVTSFDYENFQIDLIKSNDEQDFNAKMFYYGYGDLGCLLGKMINFYKLKFGDRGLTIVIGDRIDGISLDINSNIGKEIILTSDPSEICNFFGLNYDLWKFGFNTRIQIFEWIASSKYFIKGIFNIENVADRKRMQCRKVYIGFMKWLWGSDGISLEPRPSRIHIQSIAINYFNKFEEFTSIVEEAKIREARKAKYNGKLFVDNGVTGKDITKSMNNFEHGICSEYKTSFDEWLDSVTKIQVQNELNKFFSKASN